MIRWEYKVEKPTDDTDAGFIAALNSAGQEGWQLIESWEMVTRTADPDPTKPARHEFYRALILGRPIE